MTKIYNITAGELRKRDGEMVRIKVYQDIQEGKLRCTDLGSCTINGYHLFSSYEGNGKTFDAIEWIEFLDETPKEITYNGATYVLKESPASTYKPFPEKTEEQKVNEELLKEHIKKMGRIDKEDEYFTYYKHPQNGHWYKSVNMQYAPNLAFMASGFALPICVTEEDKEERLRLLRLVYNF